MVRVVTALLLLTLVAEAARKSSRKGTSSPGDVATLYTYGAPKVSSPALRNPIDSDGCFPGWRIVNRNDKWWDPANNVDLVPTLLGQISGYAHVRMPVQFMDQNGVSTFHNCGWTGGQLNFPDLLLHPWWTYVRRAEYNDNIRVASVVGLSNSYDSNAGRVAKKVGEYGWNLVSAIIGSEVVHLMQNPRTNRCLLTFGGSDTIEDFVKDVVVITTTFCGLQQRVHTGFKWEYLDMVKDSAFQSQVRPHLGSCSALEVLGHSLGGAVAALFTSCLHSRPKVGAIGYDDYKWISFTKQRSMTLQAMTPLSAMADAGPPEGLTIEEGDTAA